MLRCTSFQLQRYVENVRQLSKERDRLTAEFDAENEALKQELNELKAQIGKVSYLKVSCSVFDARQ